MIRRLLQKIGSWFRPSVPTPVEPLPADTIEALLVAHNRERVGRPPLALSDALCRAANKHATWMNNNGDLSHQGEHGSTFADRIRAEGVEFWSGGENIAQGQQSVPEAMQSWMESPGHRHNILDADYSEVGFGRSGNYWCALFIEANQSE